jgi:hypothetical protein
MPRQSKRANQFARSLSAHKKRGRLSEKNTSLARFALQANEPREIFFVQQGGVKISGGVRPFS